MMKALTLWHEVNRETNGACGIRTCGTTYLSTTEAALAADAEFLTLAKDAGVDSRLLTRDEIGDLFSGQSDGRWVGALHTPSDASGEPWQAVPAVARLAHRDGVLIREDCAVRALDIQSGKIYGIVTEAGRVACDQVVLCGGAWSSLFARRHGIDIPQISVRSTVARTEPLPGFFEGNASDEAFGLRRREDGSYTIALSGVISPYLGPDAVRNFRVYLPQLSQSWREIRPGLTAPAKFPDAWRTPRHWTEDQITPFEEMRVLEAPPKHSEVGRMQELFGARFPEIGRPAVRDVWAGMIDAMPDVVPIVDRAQALTA